MSGPPVVDVGYCDWTRSFFPSQRTEAGWVRGSSLPVFTNTLLHHLLHLISEFCPIYISSQAVPFPLPALPGLPRCPTHNFSFSAKRAPPGGQYSACYSLVLFGLLRLLLLPAAQNLRRINVRCPCAPCAICTVRWLLHPVSYSPMFFSANGPETPRADQLEQPTPSGLSLARCIRRDSCRQRGDIECRISNIGRDSLYRDKGPVTSPRHISISHHL